MTLTKEDWESDEAGLSAIVLAFALAFAYTVALAFALVIAVAIAITLSDQKSSIWYYIFRFPGALWHHWKVRQ